MLNKLKNITLEDIYWYLQFGKPKRKATFSAIRAQHFSQLQPPVFFLSTGRAGTKWFSDLLAADTSLKVLHNPYPNLAYQNKLAFKLLQDKSAGKREKEMLKEFYLLARENHIRYSVKTSRRLVETNNAISFFAPVIRELFPEAKFVHLIRHPIDFIRSGYKRNYYTGAPEDQKRLEPLDGKVYWEEMNRIGKIAWLWKETNKFIEEFKPRVESGKFFTLSFSNFNEENIRKMISFLDVNIDHHRIVKRIDKPTNIQRTGTAPDFEQWEESDQMHVKNLCGDLAKRYGFEL